MGITSGRCGALYAFTCETGVGPAHFQIPAARSIFLAQLHQFSVGTFFREATFLLQEFRSGALEFGSFLSGVARAYNSPPFAVWAFGSRIDNSQDRTDHS